MIQRKRDVQIDGSKSDNHDALPLGDKYLNNIEKIIAFDQARFSCVKGEIEWGSNTKTYLVHRGHRIV